MKIKTFSILTPTILALSLVASPALAGLELVQESTKAVGATTITWDSSFRDLDYMQGDTIYMLVTWSLDAGAANFSSFTLKRFTPRSRKDPAVGELTSWTAGSGQVTAEFKFTGLHLDKHRWVDIGNAHFKLYLNIDKDGDGQLDSVAGYGVNVHVEDPQ